MFKQSHPQAAVTGGMWFGRGTLQVKQLDREYISIRLKNYIAPAVPPMMAAIGVVVALVWFVQWLRGADNLGDLAIASAATSLSLIAVAFLVRFTAGRGMSETTGLLGVLFVSILSTHMLVFTNLIELDVLYAIPYCILLGIGSVAFWPKHWHMVLGSIGVAMPIVVQVYRDGLEGRTSFYLQLIVIGFIVAFTLYHLIWQANLRMFRLAQEIEYRAYHDALTGLNNRSRWYELAHFSHKMMSRSVRPCSLLYVDIDRFKTINDRYGHDVGDQILQAVTRVLVQDTRDTDVLARFGGEEFVVLLPDIDLPGAIACAQRLHQSIRSIDLLPHGVTVSIGVAESLPIESLDQLINRADKALLQAKETGRNRTVIASGETFSTLSSQTPPPFATVFNPDPAAYGHYATADQR
jgi:diguanylate cyclase (GGDEF)-like protein